MAPSLAPPRHRRRVGRPRGAAEGERGREGAALARLLVVFLQIRYPLRRASVDADDERYIAIAKPERTEERSSGARESEHRRVRERKRERRRDRDTIARERWGTLKRGA